MKKQLQMFLTLEDEVLLSECLRCEIPGILFLNDNVWTVSPDCRSGIEDCHTGRVYLFASHLEQLPIARRKNGDLEGPIAGCVIQLLRTIEENGVLLSGRVAAGIDDDDDDQIRDLVDKVWKCVKRVGRVGVVRPDGKTDRNYLVGYHAKKLFADNSVRIADRAIRMNYVPIA